MNFNKSNQSEPDLASLLSSPYDASALETGTGTIAPPIFQSSLFTFDSYEAFAARMRGASEQAIYSRIDNPTVRAFEQMMCQAEQAEVSAGFASGMGAIAAIMFASLRPGQRLVCVEHVYPDAYRLFERILRPFGIDVAYYPLSDFATEPSLLKNARLAYLESPNSVVFETVDLSRVAGHARHHGTTTVVDNSWATPVFQQPLALGIDLVLHSASKYISGHSDTVAGVVSGRAELMASIVDLSVPLLGAKLAPFEAWLLIRGLRTLDARMRVHQSTANLFVDRLAAHPLVETINAPGPNSVPGLHGRSGLLSLTLKPTVDIRKLCNTLDLFKLGVSWGGFESLILPAQIALAQTGEHNSLQRFKIAPNLVRLSLGLESAEDLWADFDSALNQSVD